MKPQVYYLTNGCYDWLQHCGFPEDHPSNHQQKQKTFLMLTFLSHGCPCFHHQRDALKEILTLNIIVMFKIHKLYALLPQRHDKRMKEILLLNLNKYTFSLLNTEEKVYLLKSAHFNIPKRCKV